MPKINDKPKEVKPKEVKPKEVKPKEVKPKEVKPKEVKPKEVKSKLDDTKLDDTKLDDTKLDDKQVEKKQKIKISGMMFNNEIFLKNSTYNGKLVKRINAKKISKIGRDVWPMVWQYYRDRGRQSVESILKKYKDTEVEIIYSGIDLSKMEEQKKENKKIELDDKVI
jgi:hypothetical protein